MNTRTTFPIHGGIHPPENKHQSLKAPITPAGIPPRLVLPLSQHIGAPAAPIVEVGDTVLKGQMIAKANGFVSVPIHASTSGTVVSIGLESVPHTSGMQAPCIVIEPDGKDTWVERQPIEDYTTWEKADLINRIRESGIAGMGGAGFPSAIKLNTRPDTIIETLIINGTECEPYITADDILMQERASDIIRGIELLAFIVKPKEILIGIEDNKPDAIAAMKKAAEGTPIEVVSFHTKYPSGGEKQLIQILTGKEVPSGGLPAQIGVVCQNIGSSYAIWQAVRYGTPLISRITTVTGNAVDTQQNYEVLLGSPISYLLGLANYHSKKNNRLIMGGPMMGFTMPSIDVPVVKTTNCVLAPTEKELPTPPPAQACIRCGMCAEACPVTLLPQQLFWYSQAKNHEALADYNLMDCIECGACSYVCPSNIPLVQYYRASKSDIRLAAQEKAKAEHAKERFDFRQERLEKEEAEKEAKRKARMEAAKAKEKKKAEGGGNKDDIIQAAIARTKAKKAENNAEEAVIETPVTSADPAQAAIERAMAKRSGGDNTDPVEKLEKTIASTTKKIATTQEKIAAAEAEGSPTADALKAGLEKMQSKLAEAEKELAQAQDEAQKQTSATDNTEKSVNADDPVQAIIAKAQAKREAEANADPLTKAQEKVVSLEKRLAASKEKLQKAEQEGSDTVDAFKTASEKMQLKLDEAKSALTALEEGH